MEYATYQELLECFKPLDHTFQHIDGPLVDMAIPAGDADGKRSSVVKRILECSQFARVLLTRPASIIDE